MTDREQLTALLGQVKAATGADRALDCQIAFVTNFEDDGMPRPFRDYCEIYELDWSAIAEQANSYQSILSRILPNYTASIDAALALTERVLPGAMKRIFDNPDDGSVRAQIVTKSVVSVRGDHDTWPLAILAATLSALLELTP